MDCFKQSILTGSMLHCNTEEMKENLWDSGSVRGFFTRDCQPSSMLDMLGTDKEAIIPLLRLAQTPRTGLFLCRARCP